MAKKKYYDDESIDYGSKKSGAASTYQTGNGGYRGSSFGDKRDDYLYRYDNYEEYKNPYETQRTQARTNIENYGPYYFSRQNEWDSTLNDIKNSKFNFSGEQDITDLRNKTKNYGDYTNPYANQISDVWNQVTNYGPYEFEYKKDRANTINDIANYGDYKGKYQDQIDFWANKMVNEEYDPNQDMNYKYYRDAYTRGGQQAMKDTAAQAAAMSGGYGNTFANSVGQQAYNQYMSALADKIPELQKAAMDMYGMKLDTLRGLDDTEYGRWQNNLTNKYNLLNAYNQMDDQQFGQYKWGKEDLYNQADELLKMDAQNFDQWAWKKNDLYNQMESLLKQKDSEYNVYNGDLQNKYGVLEALNGLNDREYRNYTFGYDKLKDIYGMYNDLSGESYSQWNDAYNRLLEGANLYGGLEQQDWDRWNTLSQQDQQALQQRIANDQWERQFERNNLESDRDYELRLAAQEAAAAASSGGSGGSGGGGGSSSSGSGYDYYEEIPDYTWVDYQNEIQKAQQQKTALEHTARQIAEDLKTPENSKKWTKGRKSKSTGNSGGGRYTK